MNDLLDILTRERLPYMGDLPLAGETKTNSLIFSLDLVGER